MSMEELHIVGDPLITDYGNLRVGLSFLCHKEYPETVALVTIEGKE